MQVKSMWDITKGYPHQTAWLCNNKGTPSKNGNFIAWPKDANGAPSTQDIIKCCVPNGLLAAQECYIAKIYRPYVREATFDYNKFKEFPVDLNDKKNQRRCSRKIARILQSLGVGYTDRAGLMFATNDVKVTGWLTNLQGKECIAINPWILLQTSTPKLIRLVKKEVVHRALYRGLSELSNKIVLNFALDVLSMRIIATSPYEKLDSYTVRLSENLFNPKIYKKFPLYALTDCSLTKAQVVKHLPSEIANIWIELYGSEKTGFLPSLRKLKPSALYFKIKSLVDEIFVQDLSKGGEEFPYPWNTLPSLEVGTDTYNDDSVSTEFDKKNTSLNKAVRDSFKPGKFKNNRNWNNSVTDFLDEEIYQKKDFVDNKLKELAKKLRTQRLMEEMEGKLQEIMGNEETKIKPYPEQLSDTGKMMVALGISDPEKLPLYWNEDDSKSNSRKKVAAFFDLSPSMTRLFPYMIRLVESIEDSCDLALCRSDDKSEDGTVKGAYSFAGKVREMTEEELKAMKEGKFKPGASTRFDEVIDHIVDKVNENNLDIILIFTDGEGGIKNQEKIEEFNKSGKLCYRIYMKEHYGDGRDMGNITSPFDKLNGESFTLSLPPIDFN